MEYYVGLDVSLKQTSICIADQAGSVVRESVVDSDPEAISVYVRSKAPDAVRIGLETGPTSTWLWTELKRLGLAPELSGCRTCATLRRPAQMLSLAFPSRSVRGRWAPYLRYDRRNRSAWPRASSRRRCAPAANGNGHRARSSARPPGPLPRSRPARSSGLPRNPTRSRRISSTADPWPARRRRDRAARTR